MEYPLLAWHRVLHLGTAALLPMKSFLNAYRFLCATVHQSNSAIRPKYHFLGVRIRANY